MNKNTDTYWKITRGTLLFLIVTSCSLMMHGQDVKELIEETGDSSYLVKKIVGVSPFSITGAYGTLFRSYSTNAAMNRQTPLSSTAYANFTAQIYNVTIPANFLLVNLDTFSQPFHKGYLDGIFTNVKNRLTRFGMSPYYKWIQLHIGHRYMSLSKFTLADHEFFGAGIELTPGNWRIAAMAGRLAKAEPVDLALNSFNFPVYRRTGWGFKIGYGNQAEFIDFIVFQAKDAPSSLSLDDIGDVALQPAENMVIGLRGQKTIIKNLYLDFELARSGYTRNLEDPLVNQTRLFSDYDNLLFQRKTSTYYGNAATINLNYNIEKLQVGMSYKRIDPRFKTFGAYFFDVDIENYTLNFSGYALGNFNFSGSAGMQRNNLDKSSLATHSRLIGSLSLSYQINTWAFGADFSNYKSDIRYLLNSGYDSLKVVILTSDASLNISKSIVSAAGWSHNFNLLTGLQQVNQNIETPTGDPATTMYYANLGYNFRTPSKWDFRISLDVNQNSIEDFKQRRYGIGGQIGKTWLDDRLTLSIGSQAYFNHSLDGESKNMQVSQSMQVLWAINSLNSLELKFSAIQNQRELGGIKDKFSEMVISLGYNGHFDYAPRFFKTKSGQ